mmetsp:Transcript_18490/g.46683  ORF Transcript_18490/g.46683 Transcript_18490/m.46683 type:complete len:80 (+) Transcript_18490:245-484(+)
MQRAHCNSDPNLFDLQCPYCRMIGDTLCGWCAGESGSSWFQSTIREKTELTSAAEVPEEGEHCSSCPKAAVIGATKVCL